jgi:hypothetical protein
MEAVGEAKIVKGTVPVPLGRRVIGDTMKRLTPTGGVPIHDADNVTVALNPLTERAVTVAEPLPPWVNMMLGVEVSEKSGVGAVELVVLVDVWLVNGAVTEKVAEVESPLGLPIAVTV